MSEVGAYVAGALKKALPKEVAEKGRHHVLDTLAAMVSGSRLLPGEKAIGYVRTLGGAREACVVGTGLVTSAVNAALANGMFAHADETDDSHHPSNMHPGCGIVPAAFAMAEREGRDGKSMLRAVVLGYDIGCRLTRALHPAAFRAAGHSNHSFGGVFGAAAAAGALARLDVTRVRHLLSYTAQQASGIRTFERDGEHVLKAFVFGGMTARNGVAAATMVAHGLTGVADEFSGRRHRDFFSIYSPDPAPEEMVRGLGSEYEIMNTNIKKWSVGSPIQAALGSLQALMREHDLKAAEVEKITVQVQDHEAAIVDNRDMPDICLQHLAAVMLLDGKVTFASAHDKARIRDRRVLALRKRIDLVGSAELTRSGGRQAVVEVVTRDGRRLVHHTRAVRGTARDPMTRAEVEEKCMDLVAPMLGRRRGRALIDAVWSLERVQNVRVLRTLLHS
ncbi:MAG: MmgE/PrpD family protein [Betaproteobacteria bacterium]|nr:MmgE/PrpD family protein [Betaproteobacteria bacterium]